MLGSCTRGLSPSLESQLSKGSEHYHAAEPALGTLPAPLGIFTCGSRSLCDSGCHPRYSPRTSRCERDEMTPAAAASRMPKGSMAYTVKMMKRKKDTWRRTWGAEGPGCACEAYRLSLRSTFPQALDCDSPHLIPGAHHTPSEQKPIAQSQQCSPYEARKRSCPSLQLLFPGSEPQKQGEATQSTQHSCQEAWV